MNNNETKTAEWLQYELSLIASKDTFLIEYVKGLVDQLGEPLEELYVVELPSSDGGASYLTKDRLSGDVRVGMMQVSHNMDSRFTLEEIRAVDERYLEFAIPAKEVGYFKRINEFVETQIAENKEAQLAENEEV